GDSFTTGFVAAIGQAHALHERFRNGHSQFVHHEFGVAMAGKRPDAADHRDFEGLDALQEFFEQIEIENRLRDHVFGAGFHFPLEPVQFFLQVDGAGIGSHADQQTGLRAHGIAADIQPVVQVVGDVDQADGIDVEDRGGIGVGAHARRVSGNADEVANAGGLGAEQFGLDAEDVAVAATKMVDGFDTGLLLDQLASDLSAQAGAGARAIGHVDAVDAGQGAETRAGDFTGGVHATRREDLDESDKLAPRQFRTELGFFARRHRRHGLGFGLRFLYRDA